MKDDNSLVMGELRAVPPSDLSSFYESAMIKVGMRRVKDRVESE
jgi:hypothetical protein